MEQGTLSVPFEVVYVDAHFDMGIADYGTFEIVTEVVHWPLPIREQAENRCHLNSGNYLAYALACHWISHLIFVMHPKDQLDDELPRLIPFDSNDGQTGEFHINKYAQGTKQEDFMYDPDPEPIGCDLIVPARIVRGTNYKNTTPFAYVTVSHSPSFTPPSADRILDVIKEYILECQ